MEVLGFERSLDPKLKPSAAELAKMVALLEEALDAGYLGLSIQTLPWDKLDGDRFGQPLPSYFARWSEYRKLTRIEEARENFFRAFPTSPKVNVLLFSSSIRLFRRPLKTTVISLMDVVANRPFTGSSHLTRFANGLMKADFAFRALPNAFDVWADGMDLVIFEEFAAGTEAIHLADLGQRAGYYDNPIIADGFVSNGPPCFLRNCITVISDSTRFWRARTASGGTFIP